MKFKNVNIAVQLLPIGTPDAQTAYNYVDEAISVIRKSGLKYEVCPFETVLEGDYDTIMQVIKEIQETVFEKGLGHLIVNLKIENCAASDLSFEVKTQKFRS